MAYVVLVVNVPNKSIDQLNSDLMFPNKPSAGIIACADMLAGMAAHLPAGNVQITSRDTDPGVSTSGVDSQQLNYNKL